jgi:glycerol-3-phosphate O-acyltransferase
MKKWIEGSQELNFTYSIAAFSNLKPFFDNIRQFWQMEPDETEDTIGHLHSSLQSFVKNTQTVDKLLELRKNCSTVNIFGKRVFHLLDAFWILKYLNFAHEISFNRGDLQTEATMLLQHIGIQTKINSSAEDLLEIFKNLDTRVENCS